MKMNRILPIIFGIGLLLTSCQYEFYVEPETVKPTEPVLFSTQIEPIFVEQGCTGCHPSSANLDLTTGKAYNSIMSNNLVDTENPEGSLILTKPSSKGFHPKTYTAQQEVLVLSWIEDGAQNN